MSFNCNFSLFLHFTPFYFISILPIRTRKHKFIASDVCTSLIQCTLHYSPICFHSSLVGCEVVEHDTQIHTYSIKPSRAKQLISQPYRKREREKNFTIAQPQVHQRLSLTTLLGKHKTSQIFIIRGKESYFTRDFF